MKSESNSHEDVSGLVDPPVAARAAGLRYVQDGSAGYRRAGAPGKFRYLDKDGKTVKDADVLARIKSLVIPPAWTEVWISAHANAHLQATGRDARGRKQYRYHPRWRAVRDEVKYHRMLNFGQALPAIRKEVDKALRLPGLPREKMLATVVSLLQVTMMRIGNEEYARTNKSFGLTTLRDRHVSIDGSEVEFHFRGKSGVMHQVKVHDARLARIIRATRDLPGQDLFQYVDEEGQQHSIGSADVNDYLRSITGEDYTAKDFRTWAGTVLAALALQEFEKFDSQTEAKKNIVRAIEHVAERLGNTPSVCRKCYVHPAVIEAYLEGTVAEALSDRAEKAMKEDLHSLTAEEGAVLALLSQRLHAEEKKKNAAPKASRAKISKAGKR